MKSLIVIIVTSVLVIFTFNVEAQGLFQNNSLDEAIKECKKISDKDIESELDSKSPQELLTTRYQETEREVVSYLKETLSSYQEQAKENSKKMNDKKFKVSVKDDKIESLTTEYLSKYREHLLENNLAELDSTYINSITKVILRKYYVKTLCSGVERYTNNWLSEEESDEYIPFLKTKTLHPKIRDEKFMKEMAKEYLSSKEDNKKLYVYLIEIHDIISEYEVGSVTVDSKFNFEYISHLETILNKFVSGGNKGVTKSELEDVAKKIIVDIKSHIENSTKIK